MHKNLVKNSWKSEGLVLDDQRKGAVFRTENSFQIALVRVWGCQPQRIHKNPKTTKTQDPPKHKNHKRHENTQKTQKQHKKFKKHK